MFTGSFYTAGLFLFLGSMSQRDLAVSSAVSSTAALVHSVAAREGAV